METALTHCWPQPVCEQGVIHVNIHSLTHWATSFKETVKNKHKNKQTTPPTITAKEREAFFQHLFFFFFLPLNASITCWRVSREIPLYPFARTLILSANSMRDLSGVKGFPTPETVMGSVTHLLATSQGRESTKRFLVTCRMWTNQVHLKLPMKIKKSYIKK